MFRLSLVLVAVLSLGLAPAADAKPSWLKVPKFMKKSTATKQASKPVKASPKQRARVGKDVQRLESILANVKTSAKLTDKAWKSAANEASTLAERIYTNVKSVTSDKDPVRKAEQLRDHVKNMKKEAYNRDYKSTKRHAERALAVASQLDEWAG